MGLREHVRDLLTAIRQAVFMPRGKVSSGDDPEEEEIEELVALDII